MRYRTNTAETTTLSHRYESSIRLYNTHKRIPYLTESCMVLQMCSMALRITGSLVSSTWCLKAREQSRTSIRNINVSATTLNNLMTWTLTWWRPPWWICRPPPSRCPSGTCPGMAGIAPEEPKRAKTENVARLMALESQFHRCSSSCRSSPWRRGQRSRGSRWGSSWSPTAATRRTDTRQLVQSRRKEEGGE